jgi:AcrR family transcriptional regulator
MINDEFTATNAPHQPSPTRSGRPRDARAHQAILDATLALLREGGYAGLTIEAVARRAAVAKTTIYRRWQSKGLLVYEAVFTRSESAPLPETGAFESDLRVAVTNLVAEYSAPEAGAALPGLLADFGSDPLLRQLIREHFLPLARAYLAAIFAPARARGEIRVDAPVDMVFDALVGAVFFRTLTGETPPSGGVDELVALVMKGVRRT